MIWMRDEKIKPLTTINVMMWLNSFIMTQTWRSVNVWLGMKDSNLRMPESKSGALTSLANPQILSTNHKADEFVTLLPPLLKMDLVPLVARTRLYRKS